MAILISFPVLSKCSANVLVSLTNNVGKVLAAVHEIKLSGSVSLANGLQVAQLVLKHRQNKNQKQRIVAFVGSPLEEDEKSLVKLAKKLKKNNVAVDIVNFGEESLNTSKLEAFIEAINSQDNSHLLNIPPGPHILSDLLISSPIIQGEDGAGAGFHAGGSAGFEFGVDPSLDPELALALRISMEEEKARQEATQGGSSSKESGAAAASSSAAPPYAQAPAAGNDEDAILAEAIAMSMGQAPGSPDVQMKDANEDEELQRAIQMSMEGGSGANSDLINSVLGTLPGVDPNDPRFKEMQKKDSDKKKPDGKNGEK